MATKWPLSRIADALIDASLMGDEVAAQRNGTTTRSLRRWRSILPTEPALAELIREKSAPVQAARAAERIEWASDRHLVLRDFLGGLREMLVKCKELVALATGPEHLTAVNGALHACAGVAKIVGELDVAANALSEDEPDELEPRADRPGPPPQAAASGAPGAQAGAGVH